MRELLGPRHAVERVERHPVPAPDRVGSAVHDEAVAVELDRAEADRELAPADAQRVEPLLAVAVRPPELRPRRRAARRRHARRPVAVEQLELAVAAHDARVPFERHARDDVPCGARRPERHRPPDPLVDEPRAEVPAVAHAALVHAHAARLADLRLALRRRVDDDREQVLAGGDVDRERRERALVMARPRSPSTKTVASWSTPSNTIVAAVDRDAAAVDPGALGHPLGEAAAALEVDVGDLARAHQVVERRCRARGRAASRARPTALSGPTCQRHSSPRQPRSCQPSPSSELTARADRSRAPAPRVARHEERLELVRAEARLERAAEQLEPCAAPARPARLVGAHDAARRRPRRA